MNKYIKSAVITICLISLGLSAHAKFLNKFEGVHNGTGNLVKFTELADGSYVGFWGRNAVSKEQVNKVMSRSTSSLGLIEGKFFLTKTLSQKYVMNEQSDGSWIVKKTYRGVTTSRVYSRINALTISGSLVISKRITKFVPIEVDKIVIKKVYPKFESPFVQFENKVSESISAKEAEVISSVDGKTTFAEDGEILSTVRESGQYLSTIVRDIFKMDLNVFWKYNPNMKGRFVGVGEVIYKYGPENKTMNPANAEVLSEVRKSGQPLWSIVRNTFKMDLRDFWKYNPDMKGRFVGVGEVIYKYGPNHTIQSGEEIQDVALGLGITLEELYQDNPFLKHKDLSAGEVVYRYGNLVSTPIEKVDGAIEAAEFARARDIKALMKSDKAPRYNAITLSGIVKNVATSGGQTYEYYTDEGRSLNGDMYAYRDITWGWRSDGARDYYRKYAPLNDLARKVFTDIGEEHLKGNIGQGVKVFMRDSFNLNMPNQRHGDWTSEIVLTVAPGVELMRPKLEMDFGDQRSYYMKADIINISRSGQSSYHEWQVDKRAKELQGYIDRSFTNYAPHTLIVTSAGNGVKRSGSNNDFDRIYSCSTADLCDYDSYGNLQDGSAVQDRWIVVGDLNSSSRSTALLAPSTTLAGILKDHYLVAPSLNQMGTSFSAPVVTGVAALLWNNMRNVDINDRAAAIKQRLLSTATDMGKEGVDEVWGHGLINVAAALSPVGELR